MDKPTTTGLSAYLDTLVDKLRELIPAALGSADIDAVHQARVATRRLSAAVDLYRPAVPPEASKPFRQTLKKVRSSLGTLRDLDVMLGHLEPLRKSRKLAPAVKWLESLMTHNRHAAAHAATGHRVRTVLSKLAGYRPLRKAIHHCSTPTHELLADSLRDQSLDFASRADAMTFQTTPSRMDPHELRIAGKALRYTFEMASQAGMQVGDITLHTFKKMQDALGLWHDYAVLAEHTLSCALEKEVAIHDGNLLRKLAILAAECSRLGDIELEHFRKLWRENGESIQSAVPLAAPHPTPPQTDPDPSSTPPPPAPEGAVSTGATTA